ncbi:Inner membrane protein YabI [compost metagenome]
MSYVVQYGYLAMFALLSLGFLGVPVPDETLVMTFGGLTAKGHFVFWLAYLVAVLGSLCGMMLSYTLGRMIGKPLLHRYGKWIWITPSRLEKTEVWFSKFGNWSVLFGYFIPGVRQVTSYLSGVYQLSLRVYITYATLGAVLWCGTFMFIGRAVGHRWHRIVPFFYGHRHLIYLLSFIVVVLSIAGVIYWRKRKQNLAAKQATS